MSHTRIKTSFRGCETSTLLGDIAKEYISGNEIQGIGNNDLKYLSCVFGYIPRSGFDSQAGIRMTVRYNRSPKILMNPH